MIVSNWHKVAKESKVKMGCAASTSDAKAVPSSLGSPSTVGAQSHDDRREHALLLLATLLASRAAPPLPILTHDQRRPSGRRGLSLRLLRAIREFYREHGGLDKVMGDVCKEAGFAASVCALTRSTGLSLAESVEHAAESSGASSAALVGHATTFFSYSWTGTRLGDMLDAVEGQLERLEAADGRPRFVWIDMFCASQNLLAGVFEPDAHPRGSAEALARVNAAASLPQPTESRLLSVFMTWRVLRA